MYILLLNILCPVKVYLHNPFKTFYLLVLLTYERGIQKNFKFFHVIASRN